jgi:antitoxin CptB
VQSQDIYDQNDQDITYQRLKWHSRRGMLELDVLLVPFVEQVYPNLSAEDKLRYQKLLNCEDPDLFQWFMQHASPEDADLKAIVEKILNRVQPN